MPKCPAPFLIFLDASSINDKTCSQKSILSQKLKIRKESGEKMRVRGGVENVIIYLKLYV